MKTDRAWEVWGSSEPYFGVLSSDSFRLKNLSQQTREEFFKTGEKHVQTIFDTICKVFDAGFSPNKVLDFGCGVGRLLIPFARRVPFVTGVDISPSMLLETQKNCEEYRVQNFNLVQSDDKLSAISEKFDLVHSYITLQHIPWKRGKQLVDELIKRVSPGGFVALQFLYRCNASFFLRTLVNLRYKFPIANYGRNWWRGRPLFEPAMQLHIYEISWVLHRLKCGGFTDIHQYLDTNAEFDSVIIIARQTDDM